MKEEVGKGEEEVKKGKKEGSLKEEALTMKRR